jgi:hypothetical protein
MRGGTATGRRGVGGRRVLALPRLRREEEAPPAAQRRRRRGKRPSVLGEEGRAGPGAGPRRVRERAPRCCSPAGWERESEKEKERCCVGGMTAGWWSGGGGGRGPRYSVLRIATHPGRGAKLDLRIATQPGSGTFSVCSQHCAGEKRRSNKHRIPQNLGWVESF